MTLVEVDGVFTEQAEAERIYVGAAQRYSFLLTTKNETTTNYAIVASMDTVSIFSLSMLMLTSTGSVRYNSRRPELEFYWMVGL